MNALDIRFLRTMGVISHGLLEDPDALKPGHVARALGITPEPVRDRPARAS